MITRRKTKACFLVCTFPFFDLDITIAVFNFYFFFQLIENITGFSMHSGTLSGAIKLGILAVVEA